MHNQQDLQTLVDSLKEQHTQKRDYVISSGALVMDGGKLIFPSNNNIYTPNQVCHEGLAEKLGIPFAYYQRMQAQVPELLDTSVSKWLENQSDKKVLLRTFETGTDINIARAFLSNSYLALDNYDVLFAALDAIRSAGVNVEITNATVTDRKLYLTCIAPEVEVDATRMLKGYLANGERNHVGNGIISGFIITNSEVGQGQFMIRPRAVILKCNNGMIVPDDSFSRIHLGSKLEEGLVTWSDQTREKNYELIISQTKDAIGTFMSKDYLGKVVERIAEASEVKLDRPVDTVKQVCKHLRYNDKQRDAILDFFLRDGDLSAAGVTHAITRHAQDEPADDRFNMELQAFTLLPKMKQFDKPFSGN